MSYDVDPDEHWREFHGCEGHGQVTHITLRFVTAETNEADVERVISMQSKDTSREFMGRTTEGI
jgi:hypothetical protein